VKKKPAVAFENLKKKEISFPKRVFTQQGKGVQLERGSDVLKQRPRERASIKGILLEKTAAVRRKQSLAKCDGEEAVIWGRGPHGGKSSATGTGTY